MGTKEEANHEIGSSNPNQRVADTTPSSDEHQRPQDLLLEIPSSALEGFVTITVNDVPKEEEEEGVCRICLVEVGEDSQTLRMECSCKGGLALAHQQCALEWFTLKGDKICDVCKQEVHDLSFAPTASQMVVASEGIDRWTRVNDELLRLALVASLAYFCVIETLTVRHYGFGSTYEALLFSIILGTMTSWTSNALVWSKYVWVYAAAQFVLVLLAAHFIPTGHPKGPPVSFPTRAWYVIGLAMACILVTLFCGLMIACIAETRLNIAAKWRARQIHNGSNQQHGSEEAVQI